MSVLVCLSARNWAIPTTRKTLNSNYQVRKLVWPDLASASELALNNL